MSGLFSTVYLLKNTQLTQDRNFAMAVNSHTIFYDNYLKAKTYATLENFQYIKHNLEIQIKIDIENVYSRDVLSPFAENGIDYVAIQNDSDKYKVYYFVIRQEWTSSRTLKLYLKMDTMNTFLLDEDYSFDKKTEVVREHRDRFFNSFITKDDKKYYRRKVDFNSENLGNTTFKNSDTILNDSNIKDLDWYLCYKTDVSSASENVPVKAYIIPSKDIEAYIHRDYNYRFNFSEMTTTLKAVISFGEPLSYYIDRIKIDEIEITSLEKNTIYYLKIDLDTGNASLYQFVPGSEDILLKTGYVSTGIDAPDYTKLYNSNVFDSSQFSSNEALAAYLKANSDILELSVDSSILKNIRSIEYANRTNATINKIIKLPYAPFNVTFDNKGYYSFDEKIVEMSTITWEESRSVDAIRLLDSYILPFTKNITFDYNIFNELFYNLSSSDERDDEAESKLLHSDFYDNKFVYDSFSYDLKYEVLDDDFVKSLDLDKKFNIKFVVSNTLSGKMLFDFYEWTSNINRNNEDYEHIMTVARNNEILIYSSTYLNYLKTGYNYDVKNKNLSNALSVVSMGTSAVGSVASMASGNIAGGAASMVNSLTNGIGGIVQRENAFEQKQQEMRNQSASVSGSDDVDLLTYYTGNRAKICTYQASDNLKDRLYDLFYYCGYLTNVRKVPDVNSRKWFNFLQANAILVNKKNIPQVYLEDMKERLSQGVTFMHYNNGFDFEQVTANNESWME